MQKRDKYWDLSMQCLEKIFSTNFQTVMNTYNLYILQLVYHHSLVYYYSLLYMRNNTLTVSRVSFMATSSASTACLSPNSPSIK